MNRIATATTAGAALCALALLALPAAGQVAAPSLVTLRPEIVSPLFFSHELGVETGLTPDASSFTGLNPATMQWGYPTRVGYGHLETRRTSVEPVPQVEELAQGSFGGFRLVTSRLSFGAEMAELHMRDSANVRSTTDVTNVALAIPYDSGLAFGGSAGHTRSTYTDTTLGLDLRDRTERTTVGVSFRWWEMVFLGIALTREQNEREDLNALLTSTGNRNIERYGLGFRRGGTLQMHAEFYTEKIPAYTTDQPPPFDKRDEQVRETVVAEFKLWGLLAAYRGSTVKLPMADLKYNVTSYDAGWAPDSGPQLLVNLTESREASPLLPYRIMNRTRSIGVAWSF